MGEMFSRYSEDVERLLPLHRAGLFLILLVCSSSSAGFGFSVADIGDLTIGAIFFGPEALILGVSVLEVGAGLVFVWIVAGLYAALSEKVFGWICRSKKISALLYAARKRAEREARAGSSDRKASAMDRVIEPRVRRMRRLSNVAEFTFGLCLLLCLNSMLVLLTGAYRFDGMVLLAIAASGFVSHRQMRSSILVYLGEVAPLQSMAHALRGEPYSYSLEQ